MLHKHSQTFLFLYKISDASIILLTFFLCHALVFSTGAIGLQYLTLTGVLLFIWFINASAFKIYESQRRNNLVAELKIIVKSSFITLCVISPFLFYFNPYFSRRFLLYYFAISFSLQIILRIIVKELLLFFRKKGYNTRKLLIIGCSKEAALVLQKVNAHPEFGYKDTIILLDDSKTSTNSLDIEQIIKGSINDLEQIINSEAVDDVIIAYPQSRENELFDIFKRCEIAGTRVRIVPDIFRLMNNRIVIEEIDGLPLLGMRPEPLLSLWNRTTKRTFDILFSAAVLTILAPVFLVIIILVKVTSPGPIFFTQERIGINNKPFNIYKFRSMRVQEKNQSDTTWTTKNDVRTTPIGRILRKTNLDEMPQFYNVLIGQMSVVGPRPEREHFVNLFAKDIYAYRIRHLIRVGITGWAQVNGLRGDTSIPERIKYDLYYLENWSLLLDIKIIFRTLFNTKNAM